jgi:hypothetical protein
VELLYNPAFVISESSEFLAGLVKQPTTVDEIWAPGVRAWYADLPTFVTDQIP